MQKKQSEGRFCCKQRGGGYFRRGGKGGGIWARRVSAGRGGGGFKCSSGKLFTDWRSFLLKSVELLFRSILGVQKLTRSGLNGFRGGTFERQICLFRGF